MTMNYIFCSRAECFYKKIAIFAIRSINTNSLWQLNVSVFLPRAVMHRV